MDINHVMKLAKLDLNEEESAHFASELNKILEYIDMIQSADVSKNRRHSWRT
jgi:Glu-tRNAGln amidotransferase C subunit.